MSSLLITIIGISFIFIMTVLGGAMVFLFRKDLSPNFNSLFYGFAAGLMFAASIWSLILPSIEKSVCLGWASFVPAALGVVLGAAFLVLLDKFISKIINRGGQSNRFGKTEKMFLAVFLHNIPEGLAVGLAFGNAFVAGELSAFYSALWFAIGIGLQNFPEGSAISLPMRDKSNKKAFLYSVASGAIEPIMAIVGILLTRVMAGIIPWLLAFSAGAMIFVVAEELVPEAKSSSSSNIGTWGFIIGFVIMMILDVALG